MSRNTTRPGLTRPLTTLGVALITASLATTAIAGAALAGKAAPTPFFGQDVKCDVQGSAVNPEVSLGFDGKGRWARAQIAVEAVDREGDKSTRDPFPTGRLDMRSLTPVLGVPVDADRGPFEVTFSVRPVDRNDEPLVEGWTRRTYTCP